MVQDIPTQQCVASRSPSVPGAELCCPCRVALLARGTAPPARCSGAIPGRALAGWGRCAGSGCQQLSPPLLYLSDRWGWPPAIACHRHFWEGRMREGWVSAQRLGTCLQLERPLGPAPWDGSGRAPSTRDLGKPQGWSVPKERGLQPTDTQPLRVLISSPAVLKEPLEAHPGPPSLPVPWLEQGLLRLGPTTLLGWGR